MPSVDKETRTAKTGSALRLTSLWGGIAMGGGGASVAKAELERV